METGTLWTGLIIILIMVLPFVMVSMGNNAKKKKKLEQIYHLAKENNGQIDQVDIWKNKAIALDRQQNRLYFVEVLQGQSILSQYKLSDISKIETHKKSRTEQNDIIIEQLRIDLIFKNKDTKNQHLIFFDIDKDGILNDEIKLMEKWNTLLN